MADKGRQIGSTISDAGSAVADKGKRAATSASNVSNEAKEAIFSCVQKNSDKIHKAVSQKVGKEIADIAVDIGKGLAVGAVCGVIASIIHPLLPFPVRWVISENDISDFMEDNTELLIGLFASGTMIADEAETAGKAVDVAGAVASV